MVTISSGRVDFQFRKQPRLLGKVSKYPFGSRRTANIAHTYEQNSSFFISHTDSKPCFFRYTHYDLLYQMMQCDNNTIGGGP